MTAELVRYDAMCRAIADAYEVDEVKDIRDKALALEIYARQAKNVDAERDACEIRLRAERRAGQLLKEMEKAKGGRPTETPRADQGVSKTLAQRGINYDQSARWQKLANVPEEQFDAALGGPEMPTTTGIIAATQQQPSEIDPVAKEALWLWGTLRDFERHRVLDLDPNELSETMLDHMKETVRRLAPRVAAWLGELRHDG